MKKLLLVWSLLCVPLLSAAEDLQNKEETISGWSFRVIQAAIPEFARNSLDVSRYRITVTETNSSFFVTFINVDVPSDLQRQFRGSPGKISAFEVELSRDDLRIIRSNFVR